MIIHPSAFVAPFVNSKMQDNQIMRSKDNLFRSIHQVLLHAARQYGLSRNQTKRILNNMKRPGNHKFYQDKLRYCHKIFCFPIYYDNVDISNGLILYTPDVKPQSEWNALEHDMNTNRLKIKPAIPSKKICLSTYYEFIKCLWNNFSKQH